jgi:GNAT superfamily N-acetyltransferase
VSQRIQEYLRVSAAKDREAERIGPFLATFTPYDPIIYLNYAIPDAGAEPTADDVSELVKAFAARDRIPRLEYLPGLAPAVEPALLAAGFTVEQRVPLMEWKRPGPSAPSVPEDIELITPEFDDELLGLLTAQHEAFDDDPPRAEQVAAARRFAESGGIQILARDTASGAPVGGGVAVPVRDGISELAGIAVRPGYQKRGIGGAITLQLSRTARGAGADIVFLTPGGDAQERVYARVGFHRTDTMLFLARN